MNDNNLDDMALISAHLRRVIARSRSTGDDQLSEALIEMAATTMTGLCVALGSTPKAVQDRAAQLAPGLDVALGQSVH